MPLSPIKTVSFPFQGWPVTLDITLLDKTAIAGTAHVTTASIDFQLAANEGYQSLLPLDTFSHPLFVGLRRTPSRRRQATHFACAAVSYWLRTASVSNEPPSMNTLGQGTVKSLPQLLLDGHLRIPCVKRKPKDRTPYVCRGAIVNASCYTDMGELTRARDALARINECAVAFAQERGFDATNLRNYIRNVLRPTP